jgi:hypothetical protein
MKNVRKFNAFAIWWTIVNLGEFMMPRRNLFENMNNNDGN